MSKDKRGQWVGVISYKASNWNLINRQEFIYWIPGHCERYKRIQSYFGNDNDIDKADGMNWGINAEGKGYRQKAERV